MKRKILESSIVRFVRYVLDWHSTRAVIRELHMLSDKQLKDIGITRGEISHLVYRTENGELFKGTKPFKNRNDSK